MMRHVQNPVPPVSMFRSLLNKLQLIILKDQHTPFLFPTFLAEVVQEFAPLKNYVKEPVFITSCTKNQLLLLNYNAMLPKMRLKTNGNCSSANHQQEKK